MSSYREKNPLCYPVEPPSGLLRRFRAVIVIPVYDENDFLPEALGALGRAATATDEAAVLLVVNQPFDAPERARAANRELLQALRNHDPNVCGGLRPGENLFFIPLSETDFELQKSGVGGARKVGMDAALSMLDSSAPGGGWILSLDADTPAEANYIVAALAWGERHPGYAGAIFHFEHRLPEPENERQAIQYYELYLREYAEGCRRCGSQYGFWALGSTFMAGAEDYQRCGGMRRRSGGEDFYFLQALRKVGPIGVVPDTTVYPSGRPSERVPFGTGPAVRKLTAGGELGFYHSGCFDELTAFYRSVAELDYSVLATGTEWIGSPWVARYLLEAGNFGADWPKIVRNTPKNAAALRNALHRYADGFFILKFCRWLEAVAPEAFARAPVRGNIPEQLARARRRDRALTAL